jgi:hypothetical protein
MQNKEIKSLTQNLPQGHKWYPDQEHKRHGKGSYECNVVVQGIPASKSNQKNKKKIEVMLSTTKSYKIFFILKMRQKEGFNYLIYIASPSLIHSIFLQVIEKMNMS